MKARKAETKEKCFELSKALYTRTAIEEAATMFKESSLIKVHDDGSRYMVQIIPNAGEDPELIGFEFCNYVLGLMKERSII